MNSTDFTGHETSPCYDVIAEFGKTAADGEPQSNSVTLGLEYTKSELEKPARFGVEVTRQPHSSQNDRSIPSCENVRPSPVVNVLLISRVDLGVLETMVTELERGWSGRFQWRFESPATDDVAILKL